MDNNSLTHYGRKGMKWYHRIFSNKVSYSNKNARSDGSNVKGKEKKASAKKMSEEQLKKRIERLKLEEEYKKLSKSTRSRGKNLALDILESSGKNIGTQLTTYGMGKLVNSIFKNEIVNPKKGQKDK